jgi:hypothetical protein
MNDTSHQIGKALENAHITLLVSKKIMSMLLNLLFTCLVPFLVCLATSTPFKHACVAHAFFPERLFNHYQGLSLAVPRFAQNLMHTRYRIHQATYTTPNKMT